MSLQSQIDSLRNTVQDLINKAKTINQWSEMIDKSDDDFVLVYDSSTGETKKLKLIDILNRGIESNCYVYLNGNKFKLIKHPTNNDPSDKCKIQNKDIVSDGWFSNDEFWKKAVCLDELNVNNENSWDVLEVI